MDNDQSKGKSFWPSKWVFILAAIGSAAGLGNLWRFPFLAYEHGGAAFVFALVIAYAIIGVPLLLLEIGLGQKMQKGAADAFRKIKDGLQYIGWAGLVVSFLILSYYMIVVSWGMNYVVKSFGLSWGENTEGFFYSEVLQRLELSQFVEGFGNFGGFSIPALLGLVAAWIVVYFAVRKGVESISNVVVWTATIPFVILFILIVRAVTLPGAMEGLQAFFIPQWEALSNPQLWLAAFSQTFFSLSLALGIMIAYGSLRKKKEEITKSALIITGGNFLVSIMSGIVIFGTLGYMAAEQGVEIGEVVQGGPALAFVVFPKAISLMPAFATATAVLFFGAFLLLAVDSAFSILEAFATPIRDRLVDSIPQKIALTLSIIGFVIGLFFATKAGLYILDILDHFLINYGVVIMGLLQAVIVGWVWKGDELREFINERSDAHLGKWWTWTIKFVVPVFLVVLLIVNFLEEIKAPYGEYPVWALLTFGIAPVVLAPVVGYFIDGYVQEEREDL